MALVDHLLPEFDHEMATTRKLLERVPEDRLSWKPHAKSFSLGQLAQHVANIPVLGQRHARAVGARSGGDIRRWPSWAAARRFSSSSRTTWRARARCSSARPTPS